MNDINPAPGQSQDRVTSARNTAMLVYALQALGFFTLFTYIAAVVVNYIKRADVQGTLVESHFRWQIRTFWFSLLWSAVAAATALILIGYVVAAVNVVWVIYRIAKGWLDLSDNKPMYAEA